MKIVRNFLSFVLLLAAGGVYAQPTVEPATWSQKFATESVVVGNETEVIFSAPLKAHHHIYSNDFAEDCPPQKALFTYSTTQDIEILGRPKPIGTRRYIDEIFECEVVDFENRAEFRQKIRVTGPKPKLAGLLEYQICNDVGCLSYEHEFSLSGLKIKPKKNEKEPENIENMPVVKEGEETIDSTTDTIIIESKSDIETAPEIRDDNKVEGKSLWALFLLGLAGGLLALFTPCVFPMIPMTVAFFTKEKNKKKGRNMALFYGFSILFIYVVLGLLLAMFFGAAFAYTLSTHWLPNILFFLIFLIFAFSFFGMFEITLPSGFVNKMDAQGDRGGYIGVFFIAFTLVLVSFSCTAPIVGSVSILAASGAILKPLVAMLGFSLMFAVPFTLFAFFPQWLNSLPQSGGWLNSVKVFLGFAELALAFKFLSQADLVYHWGILDRDVFLSIWIVLAILLGFYLLGKIKFPHDSDLPKVPVPRFLMAAAAFAFGLYMVPGLWGAPLKPLSGILPPLTTQDYAVLQGGTTVSENETGENIRFSDFLKMPHGLSAYFNYADALKAGEKVNKPIFIDFTGHSCANCRKMEEYVWVKPEVLKRLKDDFIIASLYCDERRELPESEWVTTEDNKLLKSIGKVNTHLQNTIFNSQGQPYYYIVNAKGEILSIGGGYDPDEQKFIDFLDRGKKAFYQQ